MASTTDNFNLDLYDTGDPASLTDQYNSAIRTIDDTLLTINDNATTALNNAKQAITETQTITSNLTALGVTDTNTASALKNKIDNTANDLAVTTEKTNNALNRFNAIEWDTDEKAQNWTNNTDNNINNINQTLTALNASNPTDAKKLLRNIYDASTGDISTVIGMTIQARFITHNYGTQSTLKHGNTVYFGCNNIAAAGGQPKIVIVDMDSNAITTDKTINAGHCNDMAYIDATPSTPIWVAPITLDGTTDYNGILAYDNNFNNSVNIPVPLHGIAGITRDPITNKVYCICRNTPNIYEINMTDYSTTIVGTRPMGNDFIGQGISAYNNKIFGHTTRMFAYLYDVRTKTLQWYNCMATDLLMSRRIGEYEAGEFDNEGNLWACARSICNDDATSYLNWGGWISFPSNATPHTIGGHTAKIAQTIEITADSLKPKFTTINQICSVFEVATMITKPNTIKISTTLNDAEHGQLRLTGYLVIRGDYTCFKLMPTGFGGLRVPADGKITITNTGTQIECSDRCASFTYMVTPALAPNDIVKYRNGGCVLNLIACGNTGGMEIADAVIETDTNKIYFGPTKVVG
jgi:hypothetical protein|nr:MAG TPA: hypothetical protein [Bacteriophage sp.]